MRVGITGISGSFGTALTKALIHAGLGPIVGVTRDEFKAEQIAEQYGGISGDVRAMVVSEGITNTKKLQEVFSGCDVLIHAAALKRISGSVYSTEEMVRTNILGTISVLKAATEIGIPKVMVISSDKAVQATNLYGGTKFVAECMAVQENSFSYPSGTKIAVARWGNVAGSRGSVIPLWKEQAAMGQSLMLTHEKMTRFMITMEQAVNFVMACIFSMKGGEIFCPVMPSARMYDVALAICGDETKIVTCNQLRPGGEKYGEALISQEEPLRTVKRQLYGGFGHPIDAYVVLPSHRTWSTDSYQGSPVPEDFTYCSSTAERYLTVEEIREFL